jgi:hypothetical protein
MATRFQAVRAEALFASTLQESQRPGPDEVREAVAGTLRRRGIRDCAGAVAEEYGAHPEIAVPRMTWAISMVDTVYALARVRAGQAAAA